MKVSSMKLGVVLLAFCMVFSLSLSADPLGTIVATFDGVLNPVGVSYSTNSGGNFTATQAGFYKFTRTGGTFGVGDPLPVGPEIWAFCIELNQTISGGSNTWDVTELKDGKNPPPALGTVRAGLLQQLFFVAFPPTGVLPGTPAVTSLMAAAIQLAVWEIVHEDIVNNALNVSTGTTRFTSGTAGVLTAANTLLSSITVSTPKANELFAMNNGAKQDFVFQIPGSPNVVIPEPSSMALFGLGLLALGALRRRMTA